jgi:hypothetical protein
MHLDEKLVSAENKESGSSLSSMGPPPRTPCCFPCDEWKYEDDVKAIEREKGEAWCFRCSYDPDKNDAAESAMIEHLDKAFIDGYATTDHRKLCGKISARYETGFMSIVIAKEKQQIRDRRDKARDEKLREGMEWTEEDEKKFILPPGFEERFIWEPASVMWHYEHFASKELIHTRNAYYSALAMDTIERNRLRCVDSNGRPDIDGKAAYTLIVLGRTFTSSEKALQSLSKR